jgi:hypothetical protein
MNNDAVSAPTYGIWIDDSEAEATARAMRGDKPDVVFHTIGNTTGTDAIAIAAERWPGKHCVRHVEALVCWKAS